jgi:hypothetical protein
MCFFLFLIVLPISLAVSIISLANLIDILLPTRWSAYLISQRNDKLVALNPLTSIGTWYVEPPTLRALTSTIGLAFRIAFQNS